MAANRRNWRWATATSLPVPGPPRWSSFPTLPGRGGPRSWDEAGGTHGRGDSAPHRGDAGRGGPGGLYPAASGQEMSLAPYFQVKVDFDETMRAWGLDDLGEADAFTGLCGGPGPGQRFLRVTPRRGRGVSHRLQPGRTAHSAGAGNHRSGRGAGGVGPGFQSVSGPATTFSSWTTGWGNGCTGPKMPV